VEKLHKGQAFAVLQLSSLSCYVEDELPRKFLVLSVLDKASSSFEKGIHQLGGQISRYVVLQGTEYGRVHGVPSFHESTQDLLCDRFILLQCDQLLHK
jgi:hypothetical protein